MFEHIRQVTVGFDGSPYAHTALAWGMSEALAWRCPLRVTVAMGDGSRPNDEVSTVYHDWMKDAARDAERRLGGSAVRDWAVDLLPGTAGEVLTEASRPDLITVVGSGGHGAIEGAVLGSVSQRLARHAAGPVVVCGRGPGREGGPVAVGVDGSVESEHALDFALARSEVTDTSICAVYAWRGSQRAGTPLAGGPLPALAHEVLEAERWLAEFVAGRGGEHPDRAVERDLAPVPPLQALVAASTTASLLVVGSRGRGAIDGMLLGSVSQAVLRQAQCPVAVVR